MSEVVVLDVLHKNEANAADIIVALERFYRTYSVSIR